MKMQTAEIQGITIRFPVDGSIPSRERAAILKQIFAVVENKENWKLPINATIPVALFDLAKEAVEFMTNSELKVSERFLGGMVQVKAEGYYSAVGA